jgi:hypothetical protein
MDTVCFPFGIIRKDKNRYTGMLMKMVLSKVREFCCKVQGYFIGGTEGRNGGKMYLGI